MSDPRSYDPQSTSLVGRMVAFFKANHEEMLNLDDIVSKFGASRKSIHTLLADALTAEMLARKRDPDGEYLYLAGPRLTSMPGVDLDAAHGPGAKNPSRDREHLKVDFSAVPIAKGVPVPSINPVRRLLLDYPKLLDRMESGDSATLPGGCRPTLAKKLKELNAVGPRKFTLRHDRRTDTVSVWRTE